MVSDELVVKKLQALLETADLQTTSEKQLRKQLEKEFREDLTDRKALIRAEVLKYLAEAQDEPDATASEANEPEDEAEEPAASSDEEAEPKVGRKRKASEHEQGGGYGSKLSEALQEFLGEERLPRPQVVKRIWEYIREHNLQDPKDKRRILPDETLAKVLKPPVTMLTMNKQLSRHVFTEDRTSAPRNRPAKLTVTEKKEPKPRPANSGFTKPLRTSPELSAMLGGRETISRPELTSAFWAYVKEHGLQNPDNKQEILCDDAMRNVCKVDRLMGFGFMKHFKDHLFPL